MAHLHCVRDRDELLRRRSRLAPTAVAEIWPDLVEAGSFWLGDGAKALLEAGQPPLPLVLTLPGEAVPIYYGPHLTDLDSLPAEESVRARVVSAHGMAVAWTTYGPDGARRDVAPAAGPADPTFHLRRPRGERSHTWRLFRSRQEAQEWASRGCPDDQEAARWAATLPARDFEDLLTRYGRPV